MQQKSELPEGWTSTTLDFITHEIVRGPFGSALKKSFFVPSGYKVYEQKNVIYQDFSLGSYYVDELKFQELKRFEIKPRDVIISCSGTVGKIAIVPEKIEPGIINQALLKLSINEDILFLPYFLKLFEFKVHRIVADNTRGSAMVNLSSVKDLKTVLFEIPPLAEQHRIVSAIEALFARLDATNEKLDKVPEILKKFRQSMLASACEGRLTEDWRRKNSETENSIILLKKIENEVLSGKSRKKGNLNPPYDEKPYDLPLKWNWASLSDVSISITDGDHQAPPKSESGIPFIVISNISSGKLDLSKTMYVPENYYENLSESRKPKPQDILYSVTGSYGIPILVSDDFMFCFQRHIALIRPHSADSSKYLYYVLKSTFVYNQAKKVATGIAQLTVPLSGLRMIRIPIPPLLEQKEIGRRVDALFAFADSIEAKVIAAREKTEKLRQSILAKAFSGELVETEAEIARREGRDYETAEVLLERIKKEKGKSGKKTIS